MVSPGSLEGSGGKAQIPECHMHPFEDMREESSALTG
jgi:hypothetical protein